MSSFQRANLTPFLSSSQRTLLKGGMSCSGSETDMSSTSNENLTSEERNAIMNGVRQEPQGEERIATELSNTLIIHKNDCHDYNSPFYGKENFENSNYLHLPYSGKDCSSSTDGYSSPPSSNKSSPQRSPTTRMKDHNLPSSSFPVQEITEIPKHYLDQSEVLKHLAKELHHHLPPTSKKKSNQDSSSGGSSLRKAGLSRHKSGSSMDKNSPGCRMSLSHPDLTTLGLGSMSISPGGAILHKLSQRPKTKGRAATFDSESEEYSTNKQMLSLALENVTLKQERELFVRKVSKLQKLESELIRLSQAHQELVQSQEKREKLELAIRARLEGEVRRLQELTNQYKEQLESSHSFHNPGAPSDLTTLKNELKTREQLIQQIMTTNRELMAERERQDLELQAQRATLQEQRNHIAILDSALVSAQETVVRLDAEANRAQAFADRCAQLQQNLNAVKAASERQLQMEKKFRLQLEKEIEAQKARNAGGPEGECKNCKTKPENVQELRKAIREKEEKIISLEAEVTKWEQRYHEESALRQMAVDAASLPKDAKIAALEKTSQEFDRLMRQARQDQLKHMDELYASQRKITELEGKMKDLESKLAERDAMITVLQKSHRPEKSAETDLVGWARSHVRSASSTVALSTSSPLHHRATSRDELAVTSSSVSTLPSSSVTTPKPSPKVATRSPEVRLSNKDSLITALKVEKERHPSHYWQV